MIEPSIQKLMEHMDSRYSLVVATARRARQLAEGAEQLTRCVSEKTVTIAVHEIADDKITFSRNSEPLK